MLNRTILKAETGCAAAFASKYKLVSIGYKSNLSKENIFSFPIHVTCKLSLSDKEVEILYLFCRKIINIFLSKFFENDLEFAE